jgi:glycosyltransferase involved in cell wall biosynthesis
MRISFLCTFEPHTAGGILTMGRARGAQLNGYSVHVVFQPFKTDRYVGKSTGRGYSAPLSQIGKTTLPVTRVYSRFFSGGLLQRLFLLPKFLLIDFPRAFLPLYRSECVVIHKPLPLSFFYMVCLRLFRYRGTICCVHSDWEGVGGYADITSPGNISRKMLVTFCEEVSPRLCDVVWCASRTLYTRFGLSGKISDKCMYLSCGGESFQSAGKKFNGNPRTVIYSGSYKSRQTVDFLTGVARHTCRESAQFRFVFLGTGPFLAELQERVAQEVGSERVECPGHVGHAEVIEYLGKSHFALLYLNGKYPETYTEMSRSSTKLFEYLCAGTIVVASDFGEARELLGGTDAACLEPNDPALFAGRLVLLDRMAAGDLTRISNAAIELFRTRFSHQVQMKELLEFAHSKRKK